MLLLARAVGGAVFAAHGAGAVLFSVVVAVEAADEPLGTLLLTVGARVPLLWAQAAAVLALCGVAVAVVRLRRQGVLLGLGTLGVTPRLVLLVGAIAGAASGGVANRVVAEPSAVPGAWERGAGGWIRDGEGWPDTISAAPVRARPAPVRNLPVDLLNGAAAGALGATLGLYLGAAPTLVAAALLLVVEVVTRGLTERAVVPLYGGVAPAALAGIVLLVLLLRAPLFPRRWR
ncbi:MAG: hypothetical protein V4850_12360 [Myxococcota bacterium]